MTRTLAIALLLSGPLAGAALAESLLPLALAALPDETMALKVHAVGMQLYECKPGTDGKLAWTFTAPQATLTVDDKVVGHHGAGPSWELDDGSGITGKAISDNSALPRRRVCRWVRATETARSPLPLTVPSPSTERPRAVAVLGVIASTPPVSNIIGNGP